MAQKELSQIKFSYLILCIFILGCSHQKDNKVKIISKVIAFSQIPNDTILQNSASLKLKNGVYYKDNKSYSGYIKEIYLSDTLKSIGSYFNGLQHGITMTLFSNGKLATLRNYNNGLSYGRHFGYWENGNMKFDFNYFNDKREGIQKQWYENGKPYFELTFIDDHEDGMQKAWRENGKLFMNYEVKEGIRYGLQKTALCYTLKNEKIK